VEAGIIVVMLNDGHFRWWENSFEQRFTVDRMVAAGSIGARPTPWLS
jgi:hypothetical protein